MVYVNGVKKQSMPNDEIKESLKKSGWNAEQIRYIMRKYEGRNTGLPSFKKTNLVNQQVPEKNQISMSTKNLQNKDNQGHKL
jgi:histidyl-tRNA synthetase